MVSYIVGDLCRLGDDQPAEEAGVVKPISLLLETIQVIVSVERDNKTMKRRIKNVSLLTGYDSQRAVFLFKELA